MTRLPEDRIAKFLTSHTTRNDNVFYSVDEKDIPALLDAQLAYEQEQRPPIGDLEKELSQTVCLICRSPICNIRYKEPPKYCDFNNDKVGELKSLIQRKQEK